MASKHTDYEIIEGTPLFRTFETLDNGDHVTREATADEIKATFKLDQVQAINAAYCQRSGGKYDEIPLIPPFAVADAIEAADGSDDLAPVDQKIHPEAAEAEAEKADGEPAATATGSEIIDAANDPTDDE